jgi:hypothetical protein
VCSSEFCRADYVITGTPLLNREIELHTLLRLTGHTLGRISLKDFRKGYAGSRESRAQLAALLAGCSATQRGHGQPGQRF